MLSAQQKGNREARALPLRPYRRFTHITRWLAGWVFLVLGILGLLVPMVPGTVFLLVGILLLAPYIPIFRTISKKIFQRFPKLQMKTKMFKQRWRAKLKGKSHYIPIDPQP